MIKSLADQSTTHCDRCGQLFRAGEIARAQLGVDPAGAVWVHSPICPPHRRRRRLFRWAWWLR